MRVYMSLNHPTTGIMLWDGEANQNNLTIHYGREGFRLRSQSIPKKLCENDSPKGELLLRVKEKEDEGYVVLKTVVAELKVIEGSSLDAVKANQWF